MTLKPKPRLGCCPEGMCIDFAWQSMASAPKDRFILLYCAEDGSRWLAMWQGQRWCGVDELGLTREGHSEGDPDVVTGWAVNGWMDLPPAPSRNAEPNETTVSALREADAGGGTVHTGSTSSAFGETEVKS